MLESYTRLGRAWGVRGKANKGFTKVQMMSEFRDVHDKASNEWFSNRCLKELVEDQIFTRRGSNYLLNIKTGEGKWLVLTAFGRFCVSRLMAPCF